MKKVGLSGKEFDVLEHMKEIKETCSNAWLFDKYYNKKQMFKALLGIFKTNNTDDDEVSHDGEFGKLSGCLIGCQDYGSTCDWSVDLYKVEDLDPMELAFTEDIDYLVKLAHSAFFVFDDEDNIYFITTSSD